MKKLIAITLMITLCLAVFAGCSSDPPGRLDRWGWVEDGHIREGSEANPVRFAVSMLEKPEWNEDGKIISGDEGFRDYSQLTNPGTQAPPDAVEEGSEFSYSIEYNKADKTWTLTQNMTLIETFTKANFGSLWTNNEREDDYVTFTSTMSSTVVFKDFLNGGAAVRSEKTVKGVFVYIGEEEGEHKIAYNDFTVTTTYDGKTAKTTFTDRNHSDSDWNRLESAVNVSVAEGIFDNEMFIFAVRALDLNAVAGGSAAFNSFNAIEQTPQTISVLVAEKRDDTDGKRGPYAAALFPKPYYAVQANPEGQTAYPYLFYFEAEETVRLVNSFGGTVPTYGLLQFSQGYLKFVKAA